MGNRYQCVLMLAVPVLYCKILSSWPFIVLDTDPSWSDQAQAVVCGWALLARLFTPTAELRSLRFNFLLSADTQDDLQEHNQLKWRHALGCNRTFPLIINCLLCLWPNRYSTFHRIRICLELLSTFRNPVPTGPTGRLLTRSQKVSYFT